MKFKNIILSTTLLIASNLASANFYLVDRFEDAADTNPGDGQCKGLNMV